MPSASAAICAKIVFVPWPISVLAASTRTRPSAAASTLDDRGEVLLARAGEARAVHEAGEADPAADRGAVRSRAANRADFAW